MSHKTHWLVHVVPTLTFAAGVIIASIGGIMTISSSLKLAFFDSDPNSYVSMEMCRHDYSRAVPEFNPPYERSEQEIQECLQKQEWEELERFQKRQTSSLIDGVSALFIGLILLLVFKKRSEK